MNSTSCWCSIETTIPLLWEKITPVDVEHGTKVGKGSANNEQTSFIPSVARFSKLGCYF